MKKLLALVLALVMSMSLVTISNAAFKDADSIDYKEAVDVMNAVGVFVGDEKGNFNAKENLTREQAAKIIAYLELGDKAADAMVGGNTFTDVAASRWSAGYIAYCAQAGIVSGVGDSKFDPAGQLTALQFAKMLLVELGYDAKAEGMVGTDWAINTSKLMATAKLMDGIDGSVNAVITREKAAQMCLNALEAPMVTYDTKGSTITVDGTKINFGASVAKYETSTIAKDQNISRNKLTSGEYTVELGEKLYKDLKKNSTTDAFERPATEWKNKTTSIGTYVDSADLTYTTEVKLGTIYSDLGLSKAMANTSVEFHKDGATEANSGNENSNTTAVTALGLTKGDITNKIGGNGVLTEVFYDDDAGTAVVTMINTYAGKVTGVHNATASRDAYISIAAATSGVGTGGTYETEADFDVDDIVTYNYSVKSGEGIKNVAVAKMVTGEFAAYTDSKNVTVGGEVYTANKEYAAKVTSLTGAVGYDAEVYMDQYGYMVLLDTSKSSSNYAVVLAYDSNGIDGNRAKLLFTDGTTKVVNLKAGTTVPGAWVTSGGTTSAASTGMTVKDIVTYAIDADGKYTLTLKADAFTVGANKAIVTKGSAQVTSDVVTSGVVTSAGADKANLYEPSGRDTASTFTGKTIFLVKDSNGDYTSYVGVANVPSIKTAATGGEADVAIYCKDIGTANTASTEDSEPATVVYVDASNSTKVTINSASKDVIFVKGSSVGASYTAEKGTFYVYDAIVNGEFKTIETATQVNTDTLFNTVSYNSKGIATLSNSVGAGTAPAANATVGNTTDGILFSDGSSNHALGTEPEANGTIGLFGSYYPYANDVQVFYKDTDGNMSKWSISSIAEDTNDIVFAKFVDGEVTFILIKDVDDGSAPSSSSYTVKTVPTVALSATHGPSVTDGVIFYGSSAPTSAVSGLTATVTAKAYVNGKWEAYATADFDASIAATTGALTVAGSNMGFVSGTAYQVTVTLTGTNFGTLNLYSGTLTAGT